MKGRYPVFLPTVRTTEGEKPQGLEESFCELKKEKWSRGDSNRRPSIRSPFLSIIASKPIQDLAVRMEREEVSMQITMTVDEACDQWNLHPALRKNLKSEGISDLFEIQTRAIPQIMDCEIV